MKKTDKPVIVEHTFSASIEEVEHSLTGPHHPGLYDWWHLTNRDKLVYFDIP